MQMRREETFVPQMTQGHVLCCMCGAAIVPNSSNMCVNCLRTQVDITEGIQKQTSLLWCKECGRYLQPPKHWLRAEPESKELLTFCLKKIRGLQKVKLVDAGFIWTEPHSRRLKVQVTVQAEVFSGAILQQSFLVEFVVETHMCPDCEKQNSNPSTWVAAVQVRQHTEHKRTFLYLEQLILKHNADANCISIKNIHEGVDFHFSSRAHAQKFVDFLQNVVPLRFRHDKQLVSHNTHTSSYNYKYTFSVEIVPICKVWSSTQACHGDYAQSLRKHVTSSWTLHKVLDDLVCLSGKLAASFGSTASLVLCTRVTNVLTLIDPCSLRTLTIDATTYWRHPFKPILQSKQLEEYTVLDVEDRGSSTNRLLLAEAQVAKSADLGSNDRLHFTITHLGHLLHSGDTALGYDLQTAQLADAELEKQVEKGMSLPDVILVRKSYEERRRRRRARGHQRPWVLKRMAMNEDDSSAAAAPKARGRSNGSREEMDTERFLEELEEDPQLRSKIAIYKRSGHHEALPIETDGSEEGDMPEVPLEELLDDLTALQLEDAEMAED